MKVSHALTKWYDNNKRYLPWREDIDPYKIWLSEIILQQTRVNQGMPYYNRFIKQFPSIEHLASSRLDDVLLLWEGLGYYTRARNLYKTAQIINDEYSGVFPSEYSQIRKLPGIGDYTAAAIASLAFNLSHAAVDGNVYRVLSRLFGIDAPINSTAGKKQFQAEADKLLDRENPGRHNQAMIELGALVCLPKNPNCNACPLNEVCYAYKNNSTGNLPVKTRAIPVRHRYLYYLAINYHEQVFIQQRGENDIWAMLYELPVIEIDGPLGIEAVEQNEIWEKLFASIPITIKGISSENKHKLSHQLIHAWFIDIELMKKPEQPGLIQVKYKDLATYAFPKLIVNYLDKYRSAN